jgi:AAA domain, putative AbiEii toxin, Type IV TA system
MDFGLQVMESLRQRIYSFTAERFALKKCRVGLSDQLEPDATNLAEVLSNLKDRSPNKFRLLNQHLRQVFPNIHEVSVRPSAGDAQHCEIIVYEEDSDDEQDAIPLADSGTGIGQVVAMLYVLVASKHPKTILIDEPQNFLHPGAVRKLFQIFALYSQHQYVVATHLPTVIAASKASAILLVRKEPGAQTTLTPIDVGETKELSTVLDEVGARLSDVFGADSILWVEGNTERDCFPMILNALTEQKQWGTEFVPVIGPDEFVGSDADRIVRIYERLSQGKGLLPPAVGFIFDRECRSRRIREDLGRRLGGRVKFLPRRMLENYFLNPKAIAAVVNEITGFSEGMITESEIDVWLQQKTQERQYYCKHQGADAANKASWTTEVDGAKVLENLFAHFSNQRVSYKKVEHGTKLTEWLLANDPGDFKEVATLLEKLLGS